MADDSTRRTDPIEDAEERARRRTDRTLLPSSEGLGPGAGETPDADVSVAPEEGDQGTTTPTLRRHQDRDEKPGA